MFVHFNFLDAKESLFFIH